MKNGMSDLRNHLFEVIERLKTGDIEPDEARVICQTADCLLDSARIELEYREQVSRGSGLSPFLDAATANAKQKEIVARIEDDTQSAVQAKQPTPAALRPATPRVTPSISKQAVHDASCGPRELVG